MRVHAPGKVHACVCACCWGARSRGWRACGPGLGGGWRWPLEWLPRLVLSRRQARVLRRGNALSSWGWMDTAPGLSSGPVPRVLRPLPPLRSLAPSIHVLLTNGEDGLGWPQPQGRPGGPGGRPARTCPVPWPRRWPSAGLGGARGPKVWRTVEPPRAPAPRLCPRDPLRLGRDVRNQPLHVSQPWQIQTPFAVVAVPYAQLSGLSTFTGRAATAPPSSELLSSSQTEPVP